MTRAGTLTRRPRWTQSRAARVEYRFERRTKSFGEQNSARQASDAAHEVLEVAIRLVEQGLGQRVHAAVDRHRLVDSVLREAPRPPPEQPKLVVGIKPTVAHPGAPEEVLARNGVAGGRPPRGDDLLDAAGELGRDALVGVEREDPLPRRLLDREVLLHREARPRPNPHAIRELPGERRGLVGGLRVDHHDLVRPGHALEAGAQPLLLVPRDDGDGEARHAAVPPASSISSAVRNTASGSSPAIVPSGLCSARQRTPYGPLREDRVGP